MAISQSTIYGSKRYENLVLGQLPTAAFGPFASATNTIVDKTNRGWLTASLASGTGFINQVPFFSLPDLNYTFSLATASAITINENSSSIARALNAGNFAAGDESSPFSMEFLFSHNYGTTSSIVSIGSSTASPQMRIYFASGAFVFDIYGDYSSNLALKSGTKLRYRSTITDTDLGDPKHIALVFNNGQPKFYVNTNVATTVIDQLSGKLFFDANSAGRTIAKFDGGASAKGLVSMIAFYNYALTPEIIQSHYDAARNIEDMNSYSSKFGSPALNNVNGIVESLERNTINSQDFSGTNIYNSTTNNGFITPSPFINVKQFALTRDEKQVPSATYSILWEDFGKNFDFTNDSIILQFEGRTNTGSYTANNCLFSIQGSVLGSAQDEIYMGIDTNSKLYIATAASGTLATSAASISRSAKTIRIDFNSPSITMTELGSGTSASANTGTQEMTNSVAYFYNGYYFGTSGSMVERGNSEININTASFGTENQTGYHTSYLSSLGQNEYFIDIINSSRALVQLPTPQQTKNIFQSNGTYNASYTLWVDSASQSLISNYSASIASSASSVSVQIDATSHKNYGRGLVNWIKLINTGSFSQSDGFYDAVFKTDNGLYVNDNFEYILGKRRIFKFSNRSDSLSYITRSSQLYSGSISSSGTNVAITGIGSTVGLTVGSRILSSSGTAVLGTSASIVSIDSSTQVTIGSGTSTTAGTITFYQDPIGQLDFIISLDDTLVASTQYLVHYGAGSASMYLSYSSANNAYVASFSGMTASINNSSATSGTTLLYPRNIYMVQVAFTNPVPDSASIHVFSASNSASQFSHSFGYLATYPAGSNNLDKRYAQLFGRPTYSISDSDSTRLPDINIQSIPENVLAYNKKWQSYGN